MHRSNILSKLQPLTQLLRYSPSHFSPTCHRVFATSSSSNHNNNNHGNRTTYLGPRVTGMLSNEEFQHAVQKNEIENVTVAFSNIYGQLLGKRFDSDFYLQSCMEDGTHACDYLLANDIEQNPLPGFKSINYEHGYGDVHLVPDADSMRLTTWQPKTALVICDVYDNKTHQLHPVAPRSILRKQIEKASSMGYVCQAASELEYYQYNTTYAQASNVNYQSKKMTPLSHYLEDYHLLQTFKEEKYTSYFRRQLKSSGIPVENSKGEAGVSQHELNISYSDILQMADRHSIYKQGLKEMAEQLGISVSFMAKPYTDATGSGCHIHMSLWANDGKSRENLFKGDQTLGNVKNTSKLFANFLAGWLQHTDDCMVFYAPTINSYKRYQTASWAPTRVAWSYDNRTAGYRIVGSGNSLRIENRIPGADCNPYLVFAASLASGLYGIEHDMQPPEQFEGNIYEAQDLKQVPKSLKEANEIFRNSKFARSVFGADVVEHYATFYDHEVGAYEKHVSDWERVRYFERI